jgi:predicted ribosomally synthesized peptide with nif11-like leader
MSSESFKAFMTKVTADQGLREKLRAAGGDAGVSAQALADFAKGQGYSFTAEDVTGELSDTDLEGVAGGILIGLNQPLAFGDKLSPTFSVLRSGSDFVFKF